MNHANRFYSLEIFLGQFLINPIGLGDLTESEMGVGD